MTSITRTQSERESHVVLSCNKCKYKKRFNLKRNKNKKKEKKETNDGV